MPSKNTVKLYSDDAFYHVYNRGVEKRFIFMEDNDYRVFLNIIKRLLSKKIAKDNLGRPYSNFHKEVELVAFCLMPNHYHMLIFQKQPDSITKFIRSLTNSYVGYFNKRYERVGGLFQGIFKASHIDQESYLWHISRYIHLNPHQDQHYPYSSYQYYANNKFPEWVNASKIIKMHKEMKQPYMDFVNDWKDYKASMRELEFMLADR